MEEKAFKKTFCELYNEFAQGAEKKNKEIRLGMNNSQVELYSKKMLSFVVSECLMEDVDTIIKLQAEGYSVRYIDFIIRNMCEQVIQYLYIMKHTELIPEYFGENLDDDWKGEDLFIGLKRSGQARFKKRKTVSKMAKDIGEKNSDKEKIALYDIFSLKAEYEHHSYFRHMFNTMCCDVNDEKNNNDIDYMYLIFILTAFMSIYKSV